MTDKTKKVLAGLGIAATAGVGGTLINSTPCEVSISIEGENICVTEKQYEVVKAELQDEVTLRELGDITYGDIVRKLQ